MYRYTTNNANVIFDRIITKTLAKKKSIPKPTNKIKRKIILLKIKIFFLADVIYTIAVNNQGQDKSELKNSSADCFDYVISELKRRSC